jgi:hypothetical protein
VRQVGNRGTNVRKPSHHRDISTVSRGKIRPVVVRGDGPWNVRVGRAAQLD